VADVGTRSVFLTGEWRYLAMLNYRVEPELLQPFVPRGTSLDFWQGSTYVSLVGFLFRDTRVLGVPVPLHRDFEEVNLRFYVRRSVGEEVRRAVTFIKEIVPRAAIATLARLAYNEPYVAMPMRHSIAAQAGADVAQGEVRYEWRQRGEWCSHAVEESGDARPLQPGSEAEFITEHYWGYTRQRDGGTVEYQVTHPRWRIWSVNRAEVLGDLAALYGAELSRVLMRAPDSAFLAEGSAIAVHAPERLRL
jgi:uncharacterized protein YqjF (DUF2071 family)